MLMFEFWPHQNAHHKNECGHTHESATQQCF